MRTRSELNDRQFKILFFTDLIEWYICNVSYYNVRCRVHHSKRTFKCMFTANSHDGLGSTLLNGQQVEIHLKKL